jgi:hypothetical protein
MRNGDPLDATVVLVFCATLAAVPAALAYECEDQTQSGLNACAEAAYRQADAALTMSTNKSFVV